MTTTGKALSQDPILSEITALVRQMKEDQKSFQIQLGKSLVAMHKEQQLKLVSIENQFHNPLAQDKTAQQNTAYTVSVTDSEKRPVYFTPHPTVPTYCGATSPKHPVKFLDEIEIYMRKLETPPTKKLDVIREALTEEARDWASIFQISWETYEDFRSDFLNAYWSEQDQNKLRHIIATQRWSAAKRRTMEAHFAHYVGQARLLTPPIPESLLIEQLMKHFPVNLQSLWALKSAPEKTITNAAEFLRSQESIVTQATGTTGTIRSGPPMNSRFRLDNRMQENILNRNATGNGQRSS